MALRRCPLLLPKRSAVFSAEPGPGLRNSLSANALQAKADLFPRTVGSPPRRIALAAMKRTRDETDFQLSFVF